jgi:hypothetical protein
VGLERGPLSLQSTTELLGRKGSGSGLENREYGNRNPWRWPRNTLSPQKFGTNFAGKQWSSVCIVRSRLRPRCSVFLVSAVKNPSPTWSLLNAIHNRRAPYFGANSSNWNHCNSGAVQSRCPGGSSSIVTRVCATVFRERKSATVYQLPDRLVLSSFWGLVRQEKNNVGPVLYSIATNYLQNKTIKTVYVPLKILLRHYVIAGRWRVRDPIKSLIFFFSIHLNLPAALGPGVHSASNRNEYQKQKNNNVYGE